MLKHGIPWNDIAPCGASGTSCWRYFHELQRRGKLKLIYETLAREYTDVSEGAIDTTTATSFRFKRMTGLDKEKYKTRFLIKRLNGWMKNFWRVRIRRDYKPAMYKAFVYLALIIVLLRQN